ncbi:hypothetical protein STEG23_028025 [Scotinomys teguina]
MGEEEPRAAASGTAKAAKKQWLPWAMPALLYRATLDENSQNNWKTWIAVAAVTTHITENISIKQLPIQGIKSYAEVVDPLEDKEGPSFFPKYSPGLLS